LLHEPGSIRGRRVNRRRVAIRLTVPASDLRVVDVAKAQGFTDKYFTLLLRLATLDPGIVQAILEGRQPPSLTRMRLAKITNLPIDWAGQRSALGFA
jgi:site-specific DNA recombinase